jgi:hypothetical protein
MPGDARSPGLLLLAAVQGNDAPRTRSIVVVHGPMAAAVRPWVGRASAGRASAGRASA